MKTKMTLREWLPLIGMTISAFLVNTSEFMPIGLLTDISNEFHMTDVYKRQVYGPMMIAEYLPYEMQKALDLSLIHI